MKKILVICLSVTMLLLTGCKKDVTTYYTIGCINYSASDQNTDWDGLQNYMKRTVKYNSLLAFTSKSEQDNDLQAKDYFDEQLEKLNEDSVSHFFNNKDYMIYAIATTNADKTYNIVKGVKLSAEGIEVIHQ